MRERVTFIHAPDDAFDPKQLQLQNDSLLVKSLKAAREDKLTVGLYELPQEVYYSVCTIVHCSLLISIFIAMASSEAMS